ncbi:MAG: hypothetical protein ACOC56_03685 [Atribacterota bacterium]
METRKYLLVVDTTYSPIQTQFPKAIIDVQIISATDEQHARQLFLRSIPERLAQQLQPNLYIFDLEVLFHDMDVAEQNGATPRFRFVLPNNNRPPKSMGIENRVSQSLGNETITQENDSQSVDNRNPQPPPKPEPPQRNEVISQANKSVRSAEFQENEYTPRTTSDKFSSEQMEVIQRMGAGQKLEGSDEAVNGQVNTATGMNNSLRQQPVESVVPDTINADQAKILNALGANQGTEIVDDPELRQELVESGHVEPKAVEDPTLAEVPNERPLTDEEIAQLQNEENIEE